MKAEVLLEDLKKRTLEVIKGVENYLTLDDKTLNFKPSEESWSILECVEHLNRCGDFYLPEIRQRIAESKSKPEEFKPGLLGDYFAKSMLPKEKLNKMKTFKVMNPAGSKLDRKVLEKFIGQQKTTLELLEKAALVSLTKTKTSISISSWIKLRLGDTLRVVIYHNQRHLVQAEKVMKLFGQQNASMTTVG